MRILDIANRIIIGILYIPVMIALYLIACAAVVGVFYGLFLIGEKLF